MASDNTNRHGEIMLSLGRIEEKVDKVRSEVKQHDREIEELQAFRSRMKGAGTLGALLITLVGSVVAWFRQ